MKMGLVEVVEEVEADPSQKTLLNAIKIGKKINATGVIGFGGGSSMDVAKLSALILGYNENLEDAWGVANAKGPRLPLVLIPTTAGTGSEVTPISIITIGEEEKKGVSSSLILPDLAILDPDLTLGLPASTTASTGIDAIQWSQEVEKLGAGEILLTSIDRDGTEDGFDVELTKEIVDKVNIPVIASGGCGSMEHFTDVFDKTNVDAALAASVFHYNQFDISSLKRFLKENEVLVRI